MVDEELLLAISNVMDAKLEALGKVMDAKIEALGKNMDMKMEGMKAEIQDIKLYQENVIMPRLQNIEDAYLSTFGRYQEAADRMEGAYVDVGLLKKVVQNHSLELQEHRERIQAHDEKLQKLA